MRIRKTTSLFTAIVLACSIGGAASARGAEGAATSPVETAPDRAWISVTGKVTDANESVFMLDYGEGKVAVEMDDFEFYPEGRLLMEDDEVVVSGRIDDDLFEARTIEASTVFVEDLGTHFYANSADEESMAVWNVSLPLTMGQAEVTGTITGIDDRELLVDIGSNTVRVDTAALGYDPTDDEGYLKLDIGDRIKVAGDVTNPLFAKGHLVADWVVELDS